MQGKCHKSATKSSRKMNERPAPRPKGRNGQTFFLLFHFAHQGESHSYIPVCKSKPFCAVKIKVEALPHLIFHKVSFNMILAAKLISQDGVHGDRLYPYTVVPGKLIPSQRHGYCRAARLLKPIWLGKGGCSDVVEEESLLLLFAFCTRSPVNDTVSATISVT